VTETDPTEPIEACRRLFRAIADFDVPAIQDRYLQEDRLFIILEGPRSTSQGFDLERNRRGWSALLGQVTFFYFEFTDDLHAGRENDLAWVAGTLRYAYAPYGAAQPETFAESRGTWILERHAGDWKIVSEHVSFPLADPYPLAG
jgi:ketosteroid isomerase-like protein